MNKEKLIKKINDDFIEKITCRGEIHRDAKLGPIWTSLIEVLVDNLAEDMDETAYCKTQNIAYLECALNALKSVTPGEVWGVPEPEYREAVRLIAVTHKNILENMCDDE